MALIPIITIHQVDAIGWGTLRKIITKEQNRRRERIKSMLLDIRCYSEFQHLCDVSEYSYSYRWDYKNIDQTLMFSDHSSWVYVITKNFTIQKLGETGNLLGYRTKTDQTHPLQSTKGRISRYIAGRETDHDIRLSLHDSVISNDKISFYVKKCEYVSTDITIGGEKMTTTATTHKQQEMLYLDKIYSMTGMYPVLNKCRK